MYLTLDVVRRAGQVFSAVGLPERRRAVLIGGVNVAAVALAFGALHVGGTIVGGSSHVQPTPQPLQPQAIVEAAAKVVPPVPHVARHPALAPVPDVNTLFSQPVLQPTTFASQAAATDATFGAHATPPASPPAPGQTQSSTPPLSANPAVAHAINLAKATIHAHAAHAADTALTAAAGPLTLTDAALDADVSLGVSAVAGVSTAATSVATSATTSVASVATSATTGVASSVSSAVSGVASSVSGVAASVGVGAH